MSSPTISLQTLIASSIYAVCVGTVIIECHRTTLALLNCYSLSLQTGWNAAYKCDSLFVIVSVSLIFVLFFLFIKKVFNSIWEAVEKSLWPHQ